MREIERCPLEEDGVIAQLLLLLFSYPPGEAINLSQEVHFDLAPLEEEICTKVSERKVQQFSSLSFMEFFIDVTRSDFILKLHFNVKIIFTRL